MIGPKGMEGADESLLARAPPRNFSSLARRQQLAVWAFLGIVFDYMLRVAMSTAASIPSATAADPTPTMYTEFHWDGRQQGMAQSAFYVGYTLTQVPGAWLAALPAVGPAASMLYGMAGAAIFTLLTPAVAANLPLLVAVRALCGACEGAVYPALAVLMQQWAPPAERARAGAFIWSGAYAGTLAGLPLSAALMSQPRAGWRVTFFAFGGAALLWCVGWWRHAHDRPSADPAISREECAMIERALAGERAALLGQERGVGGGGGDGGGGGGGGAGARTGDVAGRQRRLSWWLLARNPQMWAMITMTACNSFGFYVFLSDLPSYLSDALGYSVRDAGRLALLPFLALTVTGPLGGVVADRLIARGVVRPLGARKLMNTVGMLAPACCLLPLNACAPGRTVAVVLVMLAVALNGAMQSGMPVHLLDVAGRHTGTVYAVMNTAGQLSGIAAPSIVGACVDRYGARKGFDAVFWVCIALYCLGAFVWGVIASARPMDNEIEVEVDGGNGGRVTMGEQA
eukprot:g3216.t1